MSKSRQIYLINSNKINQKEEKKFQNIKAIFLLNKQHNFPTLEPLYPPLNREIHYHLH